MSAALPSRRAALRAAGAGAAVLALGACARIPVSGGRDAFCLAA